MKFLARSVSRRARLFDSARSIDAFGRRGQDLGVRYASTGITLIKVPRDPKPGQYAELDGIYVFSREEDRRRAFIITEIIDVPARRAPRSKGVKIHGS